MDCTLKLHFLHKLAYIKTCSIAAGVIPASPAVFYLLAKARWGYWHSMNKVFVGRKVAAMMTGHPSRKVPQTWKSRKRRH